MSANLKRSLFIASFILPTFIVYCIFTVYPILRGIYISFTDWSGGSETMNFIGLDNYRELIHDPIIYKAAYNDYFIVFWKVIGIMLIATYFAVALTRLKIKGSAFYRIVFFFPNVISVVVIGVIWRFVYNPKLGILNSLLSFITGKPVETPWLGDSDYALWALLPPAIWAGIGFFMILLIAGIMSIPAPLYESAEIDGASQWKQFFHVTLPLLWEQLKVSVVLIVLTSLNGSFIIVSIMTYGGPDNATQVLGYRLFEKAFGTYQMGYASAVGVLILVLSLLTTVVMRWLMRRESVEVS
ncbi:carbohydrate ABC transporter permease [Cohnella silvisoli]|uniref:Sugar ABC transporter permease n=1 Tax=Cohnella silvisoli TaxID=2873699 RepID=A0ABV1KMM0_9BACL|nr:sugar ABC transporter permease [Cohnella silvisoli]MCD9020612.1 sugar ABC transporter permease [Cohnella silvisoli]